ncbi:MAG: glycosyltransferase family 2 protein [Nanoarchaeota archaeon]
MIDKKNNLSPLASVVITAFNEENYIMRCINSLLKQTYNNLEIIIIDNGSKDNTYDIAKKFPVRVIRLEKNLGPGGGRNFGASKAKGKILIFVDADMTFDKNYILDLVDPILKKNIVGTSHRYELVANVNQLWARSWSINRIPNTVGEWSGVFRAVKKDKFIESGGFDSSKGYFDDDLSKLGKALVVKAKCYHNNPESLNEAFKHSIWVGGSFYKNKNILKNYLKKYSFFSPLVLIFFIFSLLVFIHYNMGLFPLLIMIIFLILIVLEVFSFKRVIKEKRGEYLYSIPILTITKLSGYLIGFVKEMVK